MRRRPASSVPPRMVIAATAPPHCQQQRWILVLSRRQQASAPTSRFVPGAFHATRISLARLSVVRPDIASEWVVERNEDMDVMKVECSWEYVAWWKCDVCGHTWQATVKDRAIAEHGCPQCASATVDAAAMASSATRTETTTAGGVSGADTASPSPLSITHPELAARWHPTRNGALTPHLVHANSGTQVWWTSHEDAKFEGGGADDAFQRSVAQFTRDDRSPSRQAKDAAEVEANLLSSMSSALDAPHFAPMPSSYVWGRDEQMAVVSHLLAASRKRPESEPPGKPLTLARGHQHDDGPFSNQPIRNVDEALREKALSFYMHHTVKGKTRVDAPFSTHSAHSLRSAIGPVPSFVLKDDQELWKSYFTLSAEESAFSWKRRGYGASDASSRNNDQGGAAHGDDRPTALADAAQPDQSIAQQPAMEDQVETPVASAALASSIKEEYPRKPRLFETPAPADLDGEAAAPRMVARHVGRPLRSGGMQDRPRDPDGGRESFGKFDEGLLDEREAMLTYDAVDGIVDAVREDDAPPPAARRRLHGRDQAARNQRQEGRGTNFRPQRAFSLELPSDTTATATSSGSSAAPGASIQAIPNAPRVVARPRRANTTSEE